MKTKRYLGRMSDEDYEKELHRVFRRLMRMTDEEYDDLWNGNPPKDEESETKCSEMETK